MGAKDVLLEYGHYWLVNWEIVKDLSLEHSVVLAYLCSAQDYWDAHHKGGEMFYCTAPKMKEITGIEPRKQRKIIKDLETLGLVRYEVKGLPKKRFFRVNPEMLDKYIGEHLRGYESEQDVNDRQFEEFANNEIFR